MNAILFQPTGEVRAPTKGEYVKDLFGDIIRVNLHTVFYGPFPIYTRHEILGEVAKKMLEENKEEGEMTTPIIGTRWIHTNGHEYTVIHIANIAHRNPMYPVLVVYQGDNGNVWAKMVERFYETMKDKEAKP